MKTKDIVRTVKDYGLIRRSRFSNPAGTMSCHQNNRRRLARYLKKYRRTEAGREAIRVQVFGPRGWTMVETSVED